MAATQDRVSLMCANPTCVYLVHEHEAFGGFCCKKCHWCFGQGQPSEHGEKCRRLPAPSCYIKADATPPEVPMSAVLERVRNKRLQNKSGAPGPHDDLPMPTTHADDRRPRPPPDAPGLVSRRPRPPPDAPVSQKRPLPPPDAPPGPPDAIVKDDAPDPDAEDLNRLTWARLLAKRTRARPRAPDVPEPRLCKFNCGDTVQIINHSNPKLDGQIGNVIQVNPKEGGYSFHVSIKKGVLKRVGSSHLRPVTEAFQRPLKSLLKVF